MERAARHGRNVLTTYVRLLETAAAQPPAADPREALVEFVESVCVSRPTTRSVIS
jgi:hypothetical protein